MDGVNINCRCASPIPTKPGVVTAGKQARGFCGNETGQRNVEASAVLSVSQERKDASKATVPTMQIWKVSLGKVTQQEG